MLLKEKNILVGVTGSISIYKSLELIRLFIKAGANVRVIMSSSAKKFITPLSFETISRNRVLDDQSEEWFSDNNHIAIGKWADIFVLAPCSANTINRLSNGIADNLLTQTALAYPRVKILAPAANTNMIQNPITKASFNLLKLCNFKIVNSQVKELACKDVGDGALADVEDIFYITARELLKSEYWLNRKVVVSGGGTVEKIDEVRYLSNFSSGKMAASIAKALYLLGADVCLVSTRGFEDLAKEIHVIKVESSDEMREYLVDSLRVAKKGVLTQNTLMDDSRPELILKTPYLFMVAAVSDYVPTYPQDGKLKKEMLGDSWELSLKQNIDILKSIDKDGIISIGFKAEMDKEVAKENALKMLQKKSLDGVCLNIIDENNPFGSKDNSITLFTKSGEKSFSGNKLDISLDLLKNLEKEFYDRK